MDLGGAAVGRDFKVPKKYKQWLIDIGFVDVVEDVGPLPGTSPYLITVACAILSGEGNRE